MAKEMLSTQATKKKFIESVYGGLLQILKNNGKEQYSNMFSIEGSSIMCDLPSNYFNIYDIPEGTRIEMKFVAKKG